MGRVYRGHPKSSNVQKVIDTYRAALPLATWEGHLNWTESGAPHSIPEWYVTGCLQLNRKFNDLFPGLIRINKERQQGDPSWLDFMQGIDQMDDDLGYDVRIWAEDNPDIWGNRSGDKMFSQFGEKQAFQSSTRPDGARTLQDIVDHWEEVRDRLIVIENGGISESTATDGNTVNGLNFRNDVNTKRFRDLRVRRWVRNISEEETLELENLIRTDPELKELNDCLTNEEMTLGVNALFELQWEDIDGEAARDGV